MTYGSKPSPPRRPATSSAARSPAGASVRIWSADVFDQASIRRSRRDVLSSDSAQAYADAEMRRRARAFVTVEGTTAGSPDLVPGARLDLRRVGGPFEGDGYRVTFAHHSYDPTTGYRTRFRAERPQVTS